MKTQTVPLYWGGEDGVKKMGFNTAGIIFFESKDDLNKKLREISPKLYMSMKNATIDNLKRLIELRNEQKMLFYLNSVIPGYMHTTDSYLGYGYNKLNLRLEGLNLKL
jgi:hypothetical protein